MHWTVIQGIHHFAKMLDVVLGKFEAMSLLVPRDEEFLLSAMQRNLEVFAFIVWWFGDVFLVLCSPCDFEHDCVHSFFVIRHDSLGCVHLQSQSQAASAFLSEVKECLVNFVC